MVWWNWVIVLIGISCVFYTSFLCKKHMNSVADFLTARRGAGRYLLAVASGEAALGLVSMVSALEYSFVGGFAVGPFWGRLTSIIMIALALSGYCVYRFRETRAMTLGQFLELRYNKGFRIYAAILQGIAGVVNYAMIPAVGTRVFMYFCDLPFEIVIGGWHIRTFFLLMAIILSISLIIVMTGGQISIMTTCCIQGIASYPLYLIFVGYLIYHYSFDADIFPALADRLPGESMLNPYDVKNLRNFNLFFVFVGMFSSILNRMSWCSTQGYSSAAINAHEQKMSGVLGMWKDGFSGMMFVVIGVIVFAIFNSAQFQPKAREISHSMIEKVSRDVLKSDYTSITSQPLPEGSAKEIETKSYEAVKAVNPAQAQTFRTIFNQMRGIMTLKHILPTALLGLFCILMIFLMVSTDTSCIHSWGAVIVQDIILPLRKNPLSPRNHMLLLKLMMCAVALFAFLFSMFFSQFDYLYMFFAITSAIWLGGAGPCIVLGLYWKRGTTQGAFAALTSGTLIAVGGFFLQGTWVKTIYPFLERTGSLPILTKIIEGISAPFEPYILWRVTPDSFPLNSQEIYFIAMLSSLLLYCVISLLTGKGKVHDMDKLLHRGKYRVEGTELKKQQWSIKGICSTLIGIDSNYTTGDKAIALSVFIYSIVWGLGSWFFAVIWNSISPWPIEWWGNWFFLFNYILPLIIGLVSTIWFFFGGVFDLRKYFAFLNSTKSDTTDNGSVKNSDN